MVFEGTDISGAKTTVFAPLTPRNKITPKPPLVLHYRPMGKIMYGCYRVQKLAYRIYYAVRGILSYIALTHEERKTLHTIKRSLLILSDTQRNLTPIIENLSEERIRALFEKRLHATRFVLGTYRSLLCLTTIIHKKEALNSFAANTIATLMERLYCFSSKDQPVTYENFSIFIQNYVSLLLEKGLSFDKRLLSLCVYDMFQQAKTIAKQTHSSLSESLISNLTGFGYPVGTMSRAVFCLYDKICEGHNNRDNELMQRLIAIEGSKQIKEDPSSYTSFWKPFFVRSLISNERLRATLEQIHLYAVRDAKHTLSEKAELVIQSASRSLESVKETIQSIIRIILPRIQEQEYEQELKGIEQLTTHELVRIAIAKKEKELTNSPYRLPTISSQYMELFKEIRKKIRLIEKKNPALRLKKIQLPTLDIILASS